MVTMMSLGRRLRNRFPDDRVDFSALPILKALWHGGPMRPLTFGSHGEGDIVHLVLEDQRRVDILVALWLA